MVATRPATVIESYGLGFRAPRPIGVRKTLIRQHGTGGFADPHLYHWAVAGPAGDWYPESTMIHTPEQRQVLQGKARLIRKINEPVLSAFVLVITAIFFSASICSASATNVYVAQNSTGTANGADCADALPVAWFNNAANWGSGAAQIGPGTTVHLCGRFTGSPGSNMLTAQGSGTSGSPITILFEPGADLTAPYWSVSGAIYLGTKSFITVNGGTNGIIENTQNGTGLTYQVPSVGIYTFGGNVTIENLAIRNLYVHSSPSDTTVDQSQVRCAYFGGSNVSVHDNVMHDAGWCVFHFFSNGDSNVSVFNNQIYNVDHGIVVASGVAGGSSGPFSYYSNYIHDYSNWDTATNVYHHDGLHCFTSGTKGVAAHITALNIYNNWFDGGTNATTTYTSHIFLEGGTSSSSTPCMDSTSHGYIYNNVLIGNQPINNGLMSPDSGDLQVYNNTIIDNNPSDVTNPNSFCFVSNLASVMVLDNNVMTGCDTLIFLQSRTSLTIDYNIYANGGSNAFIYGTTYYNSTQFSNWQSAAGGDSHSSYHTSAGLSSSGSPANGSAVVGSGTNLTSLSIMPLDSTTSAGNTVAPVARASTGLIWDVGAYEFGTIAQIPNPATGLIAVAQ